MSLVRSADPNIRYNIHCKFLVTFKVVITAVRWMCDICILRVLLISWFSDWILTAAILLLHCISTILTSLVTLSFHQSVYSAFVTAYSNPLEVFEDQEYFLLIYFRGLFSRLQISRFPDYRFPCIYFLGNFPDWTAAGKLVFKTGFVELL